ncbi:MAG: hypothetical protein ACRDUX_10455 [Mycobacterium sp.]
MRVTPTQFASLLAAGVVAITTVAAPTAAAAPTQLPRSCAVTGPGTACQSPGSAEIVNSAPEISFRPFGTLPSPLGGH